MRPATIFILAFLAAGCIRQPEKDQRRPEFAGKVVKVIDGDTIEVLHSVYFITRVRLNGIDAPQNEQAFGTKSKDRLSELIGDQEVRVIDWGPDASGQTLGDVYIDFPKIDECLNWQMVRLGMAWHFKQSNDDPVLAQAEIDARTEKLGLWVDPAPEAPWDWRRTHREQK